MQNFENTTKVFKIYYIPFTLSSQILGKCFKSPMINFNIIKGKKSCSRL